MIKILVIIFILALHFNSPGQIVELNYTRGVSTEPEDVKPQLLKGGFVDYTSNGTIQASARLLRLDLGNPNGFNVPFIVYVGASGQAFEFPEVNSTAVSNLLNQLGGIINASFNRTGDLSKPKGYSVFRYSFQIGVKYLTGTDSVRVENFDFANGFANAGVLFQTKAWAGNESRNLGIFWMYLKAIGSISPKTELDRMFRKVDSAWFYGYSFDVGLEINQSVNIKLGLYQYLNNEVIKQFEDPLIKISLDYRFGK
jgi:hypothetical protein